MNDESAKRHRMIHACKSFVDMGHLHLVMADLKKHVFNKIDGAALNDQTRDAMYHFKAYLSALGDVEYDIIQFAEEANEEIKLQQEKK